MRVISGEKRGHKLKSPKGLKTRPTEDRIKESVFNVLGPISYESKVLDGFSGSGSIGIEFLSRGSDSCVFVDYSKDSIDVIIENLNHTKLKDRAEVVRADLRTFIRSLDSSMRFDYIYLDPPYEDLNLLMEVISLIDSGESLFIKGLLIIETDHKDLLDNYLNIKLIKVKKYGKKYIYFYEMKGTE